MTEIVEIYGLSLTEAEADEQDKITENLLKKVTFIIVLATGVVLLSPYISNAQTILTNVNKNDVIEHGATTFRKLYREKDYRTIKKVIKKTLKSNLQPSKKAEIFLKANIECTPFGVIDLNPILTQLFSKEKNGINLIDVKPERINLVLSKLMYSFYEVKKYSIKNRLALLSGGFLGFGLGELHTAKKGFDVVRNFLDKRKEEEKKREDDKIEKKSKLGNILGLAGVLTNPLIALPIILIILLRGRLPFPKTSQEYDELPEPVKPLFEKPSKSKRFKDYYIRPLFNLKSPIPYCIVGGCILYFNKGKVYAFLTNSDQYRSAFGEITSIMMNQLKNEFTEFVSFVKNKSIMTNMITNAAKSINTIFKPSNAIYHTEGIFDIT